MYIISEKPLIYSFDIFKKRSDVKVFVTSRIGGISTNQFAELNIGFNEIEPEFITQNNRKLACKTLNIDFERFTFQQQIHECNTTIVDASNAGAGNRSKSDALPNSDALITITKGVTLFAQAADCVPIAIFDPTKKVAAVVHAGWRGTVKKAAAMTIQKMHKEYGSSVHELLVAIGPSIGSCCYEVGEDVAEKFNTSFGYNENIVFKKGNSYFVDLWEANIDQLVKLGVSRNNIDVAGVCTSCNSNIFFSHRASGGNTGRFGIGITLL